MYDIVSTIWLSSADMIVKIPQGIRHNTKRLVDVVGSASITAPVPALNILLSIPIPLFSIPMFY
jgi:hypothetical protein